jgi:hypothetical protein
MSDSVNAIPKEIALELCAEIRQQHRGRWYTIAGLQCWGCSYVCRPDNRDGEPVNAAGCNLVSAAYDRRNQQRATLTISRRGTNGGQL